MKIQVIVIVCGSARDISTPYFASIVQLNAHTLWAFTLASNGRKFFKIPPCADEKDLVYYAPVDLKGAALIFENRCLRRDS